MQNAPNMFYQKYHLGAGAPLPGLRYLYQPPFDEAKYDKEWQTFETGHWLESILFLTIYVRMIYSLMLLAQELKQYDLIL